jgi:YHS domain-containing protein
MAIGDDAATPGGRAPGLGGIRRPSCFCAERPPGAEDPTVGMERDPVCGMQLRPKAAGAERTVGGRRYLFCSDSCANRFDADPGAYTGEVARRHRHEGCGGQS